MKVISIDLAKISQNSNSRAVYKTVDLTDLMHSMKKDGLLQPVGVIDLGKGQYEAVYGNRRIIAAKRLGWADIPAVILDDKGENDRDVLNLSENIKRANITVQEEGRLYEVLIQRGMKPSEIAVRLDISSQRVDTALDALRNVPKEMNIQILNRVPGTKKPASSITASAYHTVMNIRKNHALNRAQYRSLLTYASSEGVGAPHVAAVAPYVKRGFTVSEAIDQVGKFDRIVLELFVNKKTRKTLESKHKKSIQELIYVALEAMPELGVKRRLKTGGYHSKPETKLRHQATG